MQKRKYSRTTNYYKRQELLKSKLPRLVIRKTNTQLIAGLYITNDYDKPDKCLKFWNTKEKEKKNCKNAEYFKKLALTLKKYFQENPVEWILDCRSSKQAKTFLNFYSL